MGDAEEKTPDQIFRFETKLERRVVLGLMFVAILANLLQRANLVDRLPIWSSLVSAALGFGFGAYMSYRMFRKVTVDLSIRTILLLLSIPIFCIFLGTYMMRLAVEELAFAGVVSTNNYVEASVVGLDSKYRNKASIFIPPGSREIDVRVNGELFSKLQPWRAPSRDCLTLEIRAGRFGLREVILPNYLDRAWGIERYRICDR